MRTRLCALVVAAFAAVLCFCGCDAQHSEPPKPQPHGVVMPAQSEATAPSYDWSKVTTVGNHSYIPLDIMDANPSDRRWDILIAIDEFEKAHADLEITGWRIERNQYCTDGGANYVRAEIFGLWVDHKPREKK